MKNPRKFLSLLLLAFFGSAAGWWPFSGASTSGPSVSSQITMEEGKIKELPAKFEMSTADPKFIAEAKKYLDSVSPLEKCQHTVS